MCLEDQNEIVERMKRDYGSFYSSCEMVVIKHEQVPADLRRYIPYAMLWGISDDAVREQRILSSPQIAKDDLVKVIDEIDDVLDEWLAGYEAVGPNYSDAYVAFSAMRMAADYI